MEIFSSFMKEKNRNSIKILINQKSDVSDTVSQPFLVSISSIPNPFNGEKSLYFFINKVGLKYSFILINYRKK